MSVDNELSGHIYVQRVAYGQEETEQHSIRVPSFEGIEPARVRVAGGVTKNLGNYESARVDVSIELPCLPVGEEIGRVASLLQDWVNEIIGEKVSTIPVKSA